MSWWRTARGTASGDRPSDQARRHSLAGLTRRDALRGGAAALTVSPVVGCDVLSTDPSDQSDDDDSARDKGPEAPMLAERVEAGDLPAVEERLPAEPPTVEPADRVGVYGGEWHQAITNLNDVEHVMNRTIGYDYLVRWDPGWNEVVPNVAESFDADEDGRVFTFTLYEAMKWSDGEPFTADDVVFAYDDVLQSEDIYPEGVPEIFRSDNGETATVEKIDERTVRFTFPQPQGLFLEQLATPLSGWYLTSQPQHYLQRFHADYNDDIEQLTNDEGMDAWTDLFERQSDRWENIDLPTLSSWQITEALDEGNRIVAERNPYYWKVDPDGSQLPYLDRVTFEMVNDSESALLSATSGDLNLQFLYINDLQQKPVLAASREESNYRFFEMVPSIMNSLIIMLNQTHEDPILREVFQNKDFRIGLSHAIDREEMVDALIQGQGEPWQAAPRAESSYFDEAMAKQYIEYDVDLANDHLDRAGYSERNSNGIRLGPDGSPITFDIEVQPDLVPIWVAGVELVADYWQQVGVNARLQTRGASLYSERRHSNMHAAAVWWGDGGLDDAILYPSYYVPHDTYASYGVEWANWYNSGGEGGEEPPAEVREQFALFDQAKRTFDDDERHALFTEVLEVARDQFYAIGTIQQTESHGIVANDFHNVPEPMAEAYMYPAPGPTRPEQYFIE